jgi:iron complex outermembrane recepter protein
MNRQFKRMLLAGAMATASFSAWAAQAQEASSVEEVVVTGTRIKRQDISGVGPATVISQEQVERSGVNNVETLLQRLPSSAGNAGNQTNAYWTGNGYGTAQVNLRGLGINRTLTLINGRRVVNGGTGANSAPDLNMIPTAIIGRIDVLKDGASAIYGADAVAGVVNIVTRTNVEGLTVTGKYGVADEGDGAEYAIDGLWGMHSERGSVTGRDHLAEDRGGQPGQPRPVRPGRGRRRADLLVVGLHDRRAGGAAQRPADQLQPDPRR